MFTALVTFLTTVTMILGGVGSPVDVILDNLSTDLVYTWEVLHEKCEDPIEEPLEDPVEEEKKWS